MLLVELTDGKETKTAGEEPNHTTTRKPGHLNHSILFGDGGRILNPQKKQRSGLSGPEKHVCICKKKHYFRVGLSFLMHSACLLATRPRYSWLSRRLRICKNRERHSKQALSSRKTYTKILDSHPLQIPSSVLTQKLDP